jgi:L,D-transpeptidase ErfK/SrfK
MRFLVITFLSFVAFMNLTAAPLAAQSTDEEPFMKAGAYSYSIPDYTVIGSEQSYTIKDKETLLEVARDFDLGYNEIVDANPGIDPWVPDRGTRIRIPTAWILPQAEDEGIVVDLARMRLFYFFKAAESRMVITFPVGTARKGFVTPVGIYSVADKVRDPIWYPPPSIRKEEPDLPEVVPPGPDNPLGGYWLQLSKPGYGIHGTNKPYGVGRRVSGGCIRLYPEDIRWLFETVKAGTPVEIVNQPVKIGFKDKRLYVEVHKDGIAPLQLYRKVRSLIKKAGRPPAIPDRDLWRAMNKSRGLPTLISK